MAIKLTVNGIACVITEEDGYAEIRKEGAARSSRDRRMTLANTDDATGKQSFVELSVESVDG